jgi:hypothetical protein
MTKYYIVPETDIERLEEARDTLCEGYKAYPFQRRMVKITGAMYQITHRRYPVAPSLSGLTILPN